MIVVADTSPLCYLVLIGFIDVLPQLYKQVFIPERVQLELSDSGAPDAVRAWITQPPGWLTICSVEEPDDLQDLDPGERDAISLAETLGANLMILDDKPARKIASQRKLNVIGLLGVLATADQQGLIDFVAAIEALKRTSFRVSPRLLDDLVKRYR
ncbi:DUF3368 domain-containing protein [Leptolyngbya cf. ectocarpi LEGE 11479]|uniref:DUF3368 domain-containing protein n=1 Tax=Leptolyngbya cf. ectocarpi LEGE 11479 TaxID=1828722 RepID=A0A928X1C9_LEPEC|nr:DUF3368 domain-containing protein [Leptolyngbya ectocarpi]MBE9066647.1 DUF3368 domain-containing protein [Leptolyngbya cf. ectocarpi LEGE 11479]